MALKDKAKGFKGSELTPGVKRKYPCKKKNYYRFQQPAKSSNKSTEEERKSRAKEINKKRAKDLKEFEKWYK